MDRDERVDLRPGTILRTPFSAEEEKRRIENKQEEREREKAKKKEKLEKRSSSESFN